MSLYGRWWGATDDGYRMKVGGNEGVVRFWSGWEQGRWCRGRWGGRMMDTSSLFYAVLEFGELEFLS